MTKRNPQTTVDKSVQQSKANLQLGYGFVASSEPHVASDGGGHTVTVQPAGRNTVFQAQIPMMADGDVNPPVVDGVPVLYARRGGDVAVILSFLYSGQDTVPEYEPGERRIGHAITDSNIYFDADGNLSIESEAGATVTLQDDGTVSINGGTEGVIYDLQLTKDVDGHVTDITLNRRSDILI